MIIILTLKEILQDGSTIIQSNDFEKEKLKFVTQKKKGKKNFLEHKNSNIQKEYDTQQTVKESLHLLSVRSIEAFHQELQKKVQ